MQEIKIENNNLHITTLDHKLKLIGSELEEIHTKNLISVGMCVYERMYVCKESFAFEKTREHQSRKREAKECRALCVQSVQSFNNFIRKSEFGFGNHIN